MLANAKQAFSNIALGDYSEICGKNCYENYARTAAEFLNVCLSQLKAENSPLAQLYVLNTFLGESCCTYFVLNICVCYCSFVSV